MQEKFRIMSSFIDKPKVVEDLLDEEISSSYMQSNMSTDFAEEAISQISCPESNSAEAEMYDIRTENNTNTIKLSDSNTSKDSVTSDDARIKSLSETSEQFHEDKQSKSAEDLHTNVNTKPPENELYLNYNSFAEVELEHIETVIDPNVEKEYFENENSFRESEVHFLTEPNIDFDIENNSHVNNNSVTDVELTKCAKLETDGQDHNINDDYSENALEEPDDLVGLDFLTEPSINLEICSRVNKNSVTEVELTQTTELETDEQDRISNKGYFENDNIFEDSNDLPEEDYFSNRIESETEEQENNNKNVCSENENVSEESDDLTEEDSFTETKQVSSIDFDLEADSQSNNENNDSEISEESETPSDRWTDLNQDRITNIIADTCQLQHFPATESEEAANKLIKKKQKCKRRRRILEYSDESDESSKDSKDLPLDLLDPITPTTITPSSPSSCIVDSIIKDLPIEKPKPKSKKQSTILLKQIEAQKLLQNAIIISAGPSVGKVSDSSESEKDIEEKKHKSSPAYKCNKRKILESSGEESDVELRTLITEPLPELKPVDSDAVQDIPMDLFLPEDLCTESMILDECRSSSEQSNDNKPNVKSSEIPVENVELNVDLNATKCKTEKIESISAESSSSESDSNIPNDVYFGTPDNAANRLNKARCSRGQSKPLAIVRNPIENPIQIDSRRFSDSDTDSRSIPNEIYFGDVKVENNVQKIYHKQEKCRSNSSDTKSSNKRVINSRVQRNSQSSEDSRKKEKRGKSEMDTFKSYIQAAGIKVKYNKLFEGCVTERQKIDAMLYQLQCYGLTGEPTYMKCRRLRKKVSAKREISELDTSAIIESAGRTRRSARGKTIPTSTKIDYIDDDQQQKTLSVIKSLVDSDSD